MGKATYQKRLKIGGHNYKIVLCELENINGVRNYENGTIKIDTKLIGSEKDVTLIHEILHIINGERSEVEVESLAQQLYQVLKDNKLRFE